MALLMMDDDERARLRARYPELSWEQIAYVEADERMMERAEDAARAVVRNYRTPAPTTAREIIAHYYRKRARNPKLKLTVYLKSIGEAAREGYIRKAKVAYDKRHRHVHKR